MLSLFLLFVMDISRLYKFSLKIFQDKVFNWFANENILREKIGLDVL